MDFIISFLSWTFLNSFSKLYVVYREIMFKIWSILLLHCSLSCYIVDTICLHAHSIMNCTARRTSIALTCYLTFIKPTCSRNISRQTKEDHLRIKSVCTPIHLRTTSLTTLYFVKYIIDKYSNRLYSKIILTLFSHIQKRYKSNWQPFTF